MNARHAILVLIAILVAFGPVAGANVSAEPQRAGDPALIALMPRVDGWTANEVPRSFFPDTLYEYIDGAAESYIGYDFRELAVGEYARTGAATTMTVEIYRLAGDTNAFGIYSAERYPDNRTVDVGTHGYVEGEVLNFVQGDVYVKLLCFEGGEGTEGFLVEFARAVARAKGPRGDIPSRFSVFPSEGRVANSEKYIRRNVMGFEDLRDGYTVTYKADGAEFEGFIAGPAPGGDASALLARLLDFFSGDGQAVTALASGNGRRVRNKYGQNMFIGTAGGVLCGVHRVPDGAERAGEACFDRLVGALKPRD